MRARRQSVDSVDEENPYWMSFSDIMSALLVIFILASVVLMLKLMEMEEQLRQRQIRFDEELSELKDAERVRKTILDEAVKALMQRGIKVEVSENHTVLSIPNDILGFDTREYEIEPDFQPVAREIGQVIHEVITRYRGVEFLDTIFVEGHTDNRPLKDGCMGLGNWCLSTARAISLWNFWGSALPVTSRLDLLMNKDGKLLFSVSGYGETRPVLANQLTEDDFRRNRRIDIRFTVRRPDSAQYEMVKGRLGEVVP